MAIKHKCPDCDSDILVTKVGCETLYYCQCCKQYIELEESFEKLRHTRFTKYDLEKAKQK